MNEPV